MSVPRELRAQVIRRAGNRCEYCGLSQLGQEAVFHIDHILPVAKQGATTAENLALACVSCSLRKAARFELVDPVTKNKVPVFHPRTQRWQDHFEWRGCLIRGTTGIGRATAEALQFNRQLAVAIRKEEALLGRHPPP